MKPLALIIILSFVYVGIFTYADSLGYDRDNACIIFANSTIHLENPYLKTTQAGNPITTGIFGIVAIPFVFLFGDIRIMTFIFYLLIIIKMYGYNYFSIFVITFIVSYLPFKTMVYRLDEFYFPVIFLFYGNVWIFLIIFALSRNWFAIPEQSLKITNCGLYPFFIIIAQITFFKKILHNLKSWYENKYRSMYCSSTRRYNPND